jgi:hypothetical protein
LSSPPPRYARSSLFLPTSTSSAAVSIDAAILLSSGYRIDAACRELHDKGQPQIVYEVIAKRIIDAAKRGERDIVRLRDAGLAALGLRVEKGNESSV